MSLSIVLATDKLPEKGSLIITATDGGKLGALGKQLDKKIGGAISKAIKIKNSQVSRPPCLRCLRLQNQALTALWCWASATVRNWA